MKKLSNRIGGTVLALLMVLSLGVSPLASLGVHAQEEGLAIKAKEDVPEEIEETGKPVDMSGYFTVFCNGEKIYGMYDREEVWYAEEVDSEDAHPYSETMKMHYFNGEEELEAAPSEPGDYSVSAEFLSDIYYPYKDENTAFER